MVGAATFTAAQAVIFTQMAKWENTNNEQVLNRARTSLWSLDALAGQEKFGKLLKLPGNLLIKSITAQIFEAEKKWWAFPDLNWGPADYESDALTN